MNVIIFDIFMLNNVHLATFLNGLDERQTDSKLIKAFHFDFLSWNFL